MTMTTSLNGRAQNDGVGSETEPERPRRRNFTAAYKLAILEEVEAVTNKGDVGAILRREGLYSSHLVEWRRAREAGALAGLAGRPRRRKAARDVEVERLRARAERAEAELKKTKAALDIVGKAHALLEMLSESAAPDGKSRS
jgi:transposase-like protein